MIEPLLSLAFSMHANKGVYALLLGSGISRSAGIPTGWEVVLDLVRKLAHATGSDCGNDPAAWYQQTYGEGPDYSKLLDQLGKSPSDRRELLRSYFEPTPKEQQEGRKSPTDAHHAIARLIKSGHIRVVVTTNFDRLPEQALEEQGVRPDIISTSDNAKGARPLIHSPATIIKLHGDYLDERIKNTLTELDAYDDTMRGLLDRILDEFGLVVCGWSGDWDAALRNAIERCTNRRFPTYWTSLSAPSEQARRLIAHRGAQLLQIKGADAFFTELAEKIQALETFDRPHPLSAKIAVATLERYLVNDQYRIQLRRLIDEECERVHAASTFDDSMTRNAPTEESITREAKRLLTASDTLLHLFVTGCYWGGPQHAELWARCIRRLWAPSQGGYSTWTELANYPAQLLFYAGGLSSLLGAHMSTLATLFHHPIGRAHSGEETTALLELNYWNIRNIAQLLPNGTPSETNNRWLLPVSEAIFLTLRPYFSELVRDKDDFADLFDRFEYLITLAYGIEKSSSEIPPGRFMRARDRLSRIHQKTSAELVDQKQAWPPLANGVIRTDYERLPAHKSNFDRIMQENLRYIR